MLQAYLRFTQMITSKKLFTINRRSRIIKFQYKIIKIKLIYRANSTKLEMKSLKIKATKNN